MLSLKKQTQKNTHHFFTDSFLTGIAFAFYGGTKFGFNILVQMAYGSETVGSYNLVISSAMIIPLFITSILGISVSKFASEARGKGNEDEFLFVVGFNFWLLVILAAAAAVGFYLLSFKIAAQFNGSPSLFKWGSAVLFLFCIYHFFKQLFYICEKVKLYTMLEIISSLLFFLSLVICLAGKYHNLLLLPMVIQLGFFSLVSLVVFSRYLKKIDWLARLTAYKKQLKALFNYSMITGMGTGLTAVSMHIFTVVLGKSADIKSVGYFSLVRSTVEPASYLFRIATMVNFPKIAYIYGTGDFSSLKQFVRRNFKRFFVVVSLVFLPVLLLTPYFSKLLFKEEVTTGIMVLFALMLVTFFLRTVGVFHLNFLNATRYPLIPNLISPLSIFMVIPFIPMVFNRYGLGGLGVLIILAEVIRSACIITLGEKKISLIKTE